MFSLTISTILACSWPSTYPDEVFTEGIFVGPKNHALVVWVWFYCIMWWIVQDVVKVYSWKLMSHHNFLGVNDTGAVVLKQSTISLSEKMRADMAKGGSRKGGHH